MPTDSSGHAAPLAAVRLLSSSVESRWKGFPFEFVQSPASGVFSEYLHPSDFVSVVLKGRSASRLRMGPRAHVYTCEPGSFVSYRRGDYWDHLAYHGSVKALNMRCDWGLVPGHAMTGALDDVQPPPMVACASDAAITAIASNIVLEVGAGCPSGRPYAEALSLALVARLGAIASTLANTRRVPHPTLSAAQLRLVLEYIDHCLADDLGVGELAALVGRSPSHFAESFRNAVGTTVHRHIVEQRLERSRSELAARDKSIAQIAADLGFASQSHFIATFRRHLGVTPSRYRRTGNGPSEH